MVCSQLQHITTKHDEPCGGVRLELVMDLGQLPPVGGVTLWSKTGAGRDQIGRLLFMNPVSVVVLVQKH